MRQPTNFAAFTASWKDTVFATAEYGVRLRRVEFRASSPVAADKRLEVGLTLFGERYRDNEARDASLLAFDRSIRQYWFFQPGFRNHVIVAHARARTLAGFAGQAPPPFDRYYMGGEDEIRGFGSWSVGPPAYLPGSLQAQVYNADGTPRTQRALNGNGTVTSVAVTMSVPIYRLVSIGGDTEAITNFEYRIPLFGPFTLALFTDAGVKRAFYHGSLRINSGPVAALNAQFQEAGVQFASRLLLDSATQAVRMSSGVELQTVVPKIHAPVRFYWAYNPLRCEYSLPIAVADIPACGSLAPPIVANASLFPNYATYRNTMALLGPTLYSESHSRFGLAIGFRLLTVAHVRVADQPTRGRQDALQPANAFESFTIIRVGVLHEPLLTCVRKGPRTGHAAIR